ncbi:MAG: TIR domain-containing protein [Cyanobacteria bacterium J06621_8]
MARKVFVSYSHKLDQSAADDFKKIFSDQRDVFIDKSIRNDIGEFKKETIKIHLRKLIKESSVTVVLIGSATGSKWWIDWEIYHSLRQSDGNTRNGLLGIKIPYKSHWTPQRLLDNIPNMGKIIDWPRDYRTLNNAIEDVYKVSRSGDPDLSKALRQRNSH